MQKKEKKSIFTPEEKEEGGEGTGHQCNIPRRVRWDVNKNGKGHKVSTCAFSLHDSLF